MRTDRSVLALLSAACFFVSAIAAAQWAQPAEASALLRSATMSDEGRKLIQERIDAVHAKFRAAHAGKGPEQFGLRCCQITQIPSSAFTPRGSAAWAYFSNGYVYRDTGTSSAVSAPVQLPSGVEIEYLDFYYYDVDPANNLTVQLEAQTGGAPTSGAPNTSLLATAQTTGTPSFDYLTAGLTHTVNNNVAYDPAGAQLAVIVTSPVSTINLGFKAVDLWWMRQVSPAPGAATFNDVPVDDPAFQFIEALADSEITAGCSAAPPLYCPDSPLTRRQMAVFLAKALGLYWRL